MLKRSSTTFFLPTFSFGSCRDFPSLAAALWLCAWPSSAAGGDQEPRTKRDSGPCGGRSTPFAERATSRLRRSLHGYRGEFDGIDTQARRATGADAETVEGHRDFALGDVLRIRLQDATSLPSARFYSPHPSRGAGGELRPDDAPLSAHHHGCRSGWGGRSGNPGIQR